MKKLSFIFALLLMVTVACEKEVIAPNDTEEVMMTMRGASNGNGVETPGSNDEDNITDPDNDEDETDVESDEDLEALNSKN